MDFSPIADLPLPRIKVRALVRCGDEYIFIQRCKYGKQKKYLVFPGGRVKKSDRKGAHSTDLGDILQEALIRELHEELVATDIVINKCLSISKYYKHDREVLYDVTVSSINWEARTGKEFSNPHKGTFELVRLKKLTKEVIGKKALHLKPKQWRKLMYELFPEG